MINADSMTPFIQSPLAVTLIGAACIAAITATGAMLKMVIQLTRIEASMTKVQADIVAIKTDPDTMRWSNYGRVTQAGLVPQSPPGVQS